MITFLTHSCSSWYILFEIYVKSNKIEKGINILTKAMWLIICVAYQSTIYVEGVKGHIICIYDECEEELGGGESNI